ncbi:MAG TPA: glycosyltransferase N-terminal domain-containing protein [Flavobacteriales bacterium]|jgi:3-deoxy-D-manno-octulosonic-acid transferase|nr:glycosyltransferase N-terminal domain-containing protein [Flavobacteriales bacterium]
MPALYDTATALYHFGIRCAAPFNPKAKRWLTGRQGVWQRLQAKAPALKGCLWMHCASVGEFEQGRPVLEAIKAQRPDLPVLLTFFSPSGYEARKDLGSARPDSLVTHVDYLPADAAENAQRLVQLLQPKVAVFVKYEFWYHHLHALKRANVPTLLVSAIFRPKQPFFRWYGGAWRRMLRCFAQIHVQDDNSAALLAPLALSDVRVSGDTRFDRVAAIARTAEAVPTAAAFRGDGTVVVCGSTWPDDERLLLEAQPALSPSAKWLVVPHELEEAQLAAIEARFPKPLARWSELESTPAENVRALLGAGGSGTLLVDRMGLLARLYQHGDVAYVGGGFGDGIHSLLEAAAWGRPVIFGPKHTKFAEAQGLIDAGGGFEVADAPALADVLDRLLGDHAVLMRASAAAQRYVQDRTGATERVVRGLLPLC